MLFTTPSAAQLSTVPCGVDESKFPAEVQALMAGIPAYMKARRRRTNAAHMRICRLAVEVDSELYRFYDRDTNRIAERIRRQAAHYRIQLSENGGFSWLVNLISTCNGISLRGLPAAAIWYVRIKSANGDGDRTGRMWPRLRLAGSIFPG
ncbi:hypothetical protein [Dyadobacter fermentans]|uniref:hypothetical protein n=1 Tax=Dyadobacter fermentans TaxID=94254 RepID=UPI001CBE6633|nr:hypothetical protein [Dyadobacter fermentans]MBZ1361639.1 hypothetical protein [Dyadobacter fermentans]